MMKALMVTAAVVLLSGAELAADEWKPRLVLQLYTFATAPSWTR
jgi:hypothetical protein